jgi:hypothetical protein
VLRQRDLARALHLEARVRDHLQVGVAGLALAGEVVAEEDRVGEVQGEGLHRAQVDLTAARDTDLDVRADEADHREDAQTALRGEVPLGGERGALHRDQEVHRHRVRVQLAEGEDDVDQVLVRLAHAGDQAGAGGQTGRVRLLHGVDAVGVRVGGRDVPVRPLGRVEVVVVGVRAGLAQSLGLAVGEQTETGAHLDALVAVLDRLDGVRDPVDVPVGRTPAAGHQAHPLGTAGQAGGRGLRGLVGLEPGVLEDVGLGAEPLRAVGAVLRAQARLQVDEVVEFHPPAEPVPAHPAGRGHHIEQVVVGSGEDGQRFLAGRHLAPKPLVHQRVQQIHESRSCPKEPPRAKESSYNRGASRCGYCHILGGRQSR